MARFDVYLNRRDLLLLDCQANLLSGINTRFVVPLQPLAVAPLPARRLNPAFTIDGIDYAMVTQFAAAVPVRDLGRRLASLADRRGDDVAALDMLTCGI